MIGRTISHYRVVEQLPAVAEALRPLAGDFAFWLFAGGLVWFDFATLCEGPRSQIDYLELARRFAVIIVSDVPRLSPDMSNAARRFTWLVDVLYDHRVKLLLSAEVAAADLYREGANSGEFARTVSRLVEMRTREYMALPHLAGDAPPAADAAQISDPMRR